MPRKKRIALANYPHHIVQRGHNHKNVFRTDKDRLKYLETMQEFRRALGLKIYGYCLMTNHVHIIVDPGSHAENLGLLMKRLAGRHTRRINRLERKTGTSWAGSCSMHRRHSLHPCRSEGRFKCSPIESDRYLLACLRYVDLNPVRAKMVATPDQYPWSSYRTHVGLTDCDWLDVDPCTLGLARSRERQQEIYRKFVEQGINKHEIEFIRGAVQRNQLTGSEAFILQVEQLTGERILYRSRGRPRLEG